MFNSVGSQSAILIRLLIICWVIAGEPAGRCTEGVCGRTEKNTKQKSGTGLPHRQLRQRGCGRLPERAQVRPKASGRLHGGPKYDTRGRCHVQFQRKGRIQPKSQQTRGIHPILFQCWASVEDGGPTLKQYLLGELKLALRFFDCDIPRDLYKTRANIAWRWPALEPCVHPNTCLTN